MADEPTRGDIQKIVTDSQRHVKILAGVTKSLGPRYEVDSTTDCHGAFGVVKGHRIERHYTLLQQATYGGRDKKLGNGIKPSQVPRCRSKALLASRRKVQESDPVR
jgi:hypothetical protein